MRFTIFALSAGSQPAHNQYWKSREPELERSGGSDSLLFQYGLRSDWEPADNTKMVNRLKWGRVLQGKTSQLEYPLISTRLFT